MKKCIYYLSLIFLVGCLNMKNNFLMKSKTTSEENMKASCIRKYPKTTLGLLSAGLAGATLMMAEYSTGIKEKSHQNIISNSNGLENYYTNNRRMLQSSYNIVDCYYYPYNGVDPQYLTFYTNETFVFRSTDNTTKFNQSECSSLDSSIQSYLYLGYEESYLDNGGFPFFVTMPCFTVNNCSVFDACFYDIITLNDTNCEDIKIGVYLFNDRAPFILTDCLLPNYELLQDCCKVAVQKWIVDQRSNPNGCLLIELFGGSDNIDILYNPLARYCFQNSSQIDSVCTDQLIADCSIYISGVNQTCLQYYDPTYEYNFRYSSNLNIPGQTYKVLAEESGADCFVSIYNNTCYPPDLVDCMLSQPDLGNYKCCNATLQAYLQIDECAPTSSPTEVPTPSPTASPTSAPTHSPIASPTSSPTDFPTDTPSSSTSLPTSSPTKSPSISPTKSPTNVPTYSPSASPTNSPSFSPTSSPTNSPSTSPTDSPTDSDSNNSINGNILPAIVVLIGTIVLICFFIFCIRSLYNRYEPGI